jgi:hypothetical protein
MRHGIGNPGARCLRALAVTTNQDQMISLSHQTKRNEAAYSTGRAGDHGNGPIRAHGTSPVEHPETVIATFASNWNRDDASALDSSRTGQD